MRTVIAAVDLPDMRRGVATRVHDTARVQGLAARSLLRYTDEPVKAREEKALPMRPDSAQTIADVLKWVDGDRLRAGTALAAERISQRPRATLLRKLQAIIAAQSVGQ